MLKLIYNIFFVIVVFGSWLSIMFNIAGHIWKEEVLFSSLKKVNILYGISIAVSCLCTYNSFKLLYLLI